MHLIQAFGDFAPLGSGQLYVGKPLNAVELRSVILCYVAHVIIESQDSLLML